MTKNLSSREKYLLVALAAVLIAVVYYLVVWQPSAETIAAAESAMGQIETDMVSEENTATRITEMRQALEQVTEDAASSAAITPLYDNATNLLNALNPALANTTNLKMNFNDPVFGSDIATRSLQISFEVENYEQAKTIIGQISGGPYRNDVVSLKIVPSSRSVTGSRYFDWSAADEIDAVDSYVAVSFTVDYYEIYHAPDEETSDAEEPEAAQ